MDGHRLVPRDAQYVGPSHRVLVAVDDEPFILKAASRALAPMLAAWPAAFTVALVRATQAQRSQLALADVHASGLISPPAPMRLYEEANEHPATDVLQAITDTQTDLLVLFTRPRSFLGELFHRSVTAAVLRHCSVPVLLLPAEESD